MKLDSLKERIARAEYAVDPDAVAEAVIRRMRFARERAGEPRVIPSGARTREPRAPTRPH